MDELIDLDVSELRQILEVRSIEKRRAGRIEQRRTPRTRLSVQATLMPFSDRFALQTLKAPIRDISRGGFRFLHDRQVPLGEQFALVLPDGSGPSLVILCTVAYWQPLAKDLFAIGARFCRALRQSDAGLPLVFEDPISGQRIEKAA